MTLRTMTVNESMIELAPPLPRSANGLPAVWMQTLRLEGASLTWLALPHQRGIAQLLDVQVPRARRRKGLGTKLLTAAVEQMHRHAAVVGHPLLRAFALVNQPDVIARAWMQRSGFVHVHTLDGLRVGDEVMVLLRAFD